jgi:hypothetical protein
MLQIREENSDKSLGLFWDGSQFNPLSTAKTYGSYREAAKEAAKITYALGTVVSIVPQVSTESAATIQSNSAQERLTAVESTAITEKTSASFSRSQHGNFT